MAFWPVFYSCQQWQTYSHRTAALANKPQVTENWAARDGCHVCL